MLDLQGRKLLRLRRSHRALPYLGNSCASKEKHNEQREEDAPRMYGMDNCCQRCNNDAEGCQRLSGIRAINKTQSRGDGDVGTKWFRSQNTPWDQIWITKKAPGVDSSW